MQQLEETLSLLAGQDQSIDTDELIDRIERHLSSEGVPVVAGDGVSLAHAAFELDETTPRRLPRSAWAFAAAVVVVIAVVGIPVWLLGWNGPVDVASDSEAVFSWGDDISEWVTPEELELVFESLAMRYVGVDLREDFGDSEVVFETYEGSEEEPVHWGWVYDPVIKPWRDGWGVDVAEGNWERFVIAPQSDPRLPDGVVFWPDWGWGRIFRGPNSSEAIGIGLSSPSELRPFPEHPEREEAYYEMYYEVASMVLRELGWAD
jgi:hypothetical protein